MRHTDNTLFSSKARRGSAFAALVVCLLCLLPTAPARAQANSNAQGQRSRTKRVTPLRTSDSGQGSRVTITSDGELNDYSAYRSGDRFVVVIPQAEGGGGAAGKGRGFEGAQVSRRGKDLVYTFKLEPGASARVNQRFNRLDVQFTAAKQPAQGGNAATAAATPAPTPRPQRTPPEIAGLPTPTPAAKPTPVAKNADQSALVTPTQTSPTAIPAASPGQAEESPAFPTFTPSAEPVASPTVEEQIAQAQPAPAAPASAIVPASTDAAAPRGTLGATLVSNWPWIIAALLALGVGLLFVGRRGARREPPPAPPPARSSAAIKESKTATTATTAPPATTKPVPVPAATTPAAPLAAATAAATAAAATEPRGKRRKKKGKRGGAESSPVAAQPAKAVPATVVETAKTVETAKPDTPEASGPKVSVADAALAAATLGAAAKGIGAAAPPVDSERVGAEIKNLLAGQSYDESVLNAADSNTRQFVVAELSAALSGRNAERTARARKAFLAHGYFEDATRDLQSAEAPGRRAAAAQTLSLVADRAATTHLASALEDPSPDVRRAAVEALAELRDPAAVGPLEALRWREKSRQVPRTLIERAVEACAPAEPEAVVDESGTTLIRATTTDTPESETTLIRVPPTSAPEVGGPETTLVEAAAPVVSTPEAETTLAAMPEAATPGVQTKEIELLEPVAPVEEVTAARGPSVRAFVEPEVITADEPVAAPVAEVSAGSAPDAGDAAEPLVGRIEFTPPASHASPAAEAVYTFDESEAAAWATRGGTGRKSDDEAASSDAEEDFALLDAAQAVELPSYAAPEFAASRDENDAAEDWADVEVETSRARGDSGLLDFEPPAPAATEEPARAGTSPADSMIASEPGELFARDDTFESVETDKSVELFGGAPAFGEATAEATAAAERSSEIEAYAPPERAAEAPAPPVDLTAADEVGLAPAPEVFAASRGLAESPSSAGLDPLPAERGMSASAEDAAGISIIPKEIQLRLESDDASERAASVRALARLNTGEAYEQICAAFDDKAGEVRDAAARALYEVSEDRAEAFTRALREAPPERRRNIGASLSSSGLADESVSQLTGESRDKTYDAFSLLFLMAKAGETAPLIRAIESHPDSEVRLAVVKLLALSGQQEVLPSFRRLAVRGSLPTEVRSAVMEAIYQISSSSGSSATPVVPDRSR